MQSRFTFFFIAIGCALGTPVSLHAAVFTPNVFDDPTPIAAPNGCNSGGRCSLREAALAANASPGADTISLGSGTYQLTIPEAGSPESGDLDFTEGVPYGITLQGQGPENTKIQAAAGLNERILEVTGSDVSLTLQGITFEGGNSPGSGGAFFFSSGAGIDPDPYNVLNCNFIGNKAVGAGGAVYVSSSNPDIVMDGGRYDNNESTTDDGGAVYLSHGAGASTEQDLVKNLVLTNNRALSGQGGAIFQSASNGISFSNLQVQGNRARDFAGGIFSGNGGSPLGVQLTDSVLSGNTVTNGDGGGLVVSTGGLVTIINSTFSGNEAQGSTGEGGGAEISNGGGIQVLNTTFSGNKAAGEGGGIRYTGGSGTVHEFTNTTISGNSTTGAGGGGIFTDHTSAISFNNVTIADNTSAGVGGGAWANNVPVILRNSIFSGNESAGTTDDCAGLFTSDGYNIFGSPNDQDCEPDGQEVGFNPTDILGDAKIGPLGDNGGPTQTHNLLAGSPAIDGGAPGGCIDGSGAFLTDDQRGAVRPSGPECDIGAVEAAVADLAIVKDADADFYNVGEDITYTLTVTNNGPDISPALVGDDLPAGVGFVSADSGCTESGGVVSCDLGDLNPGQQVKITLIVEAIDAGTLSNTATVSGSDVDTDPSNNSSTVMVNVLSESSGGCLIGESTPMGSLAGWASLGTAWLPALLLRRRSP